MRGLYNTFFFLENHIRLISLARPSITALMLQEREREQKNPDNCRDTPFLELGLGFSIILKFPSDCYLHLTSGHPSLTGISLCSDAMRQPSKFNHVLWQLLHTHIHTRAYLYELLMRFLIVYDGKTTGVLWTPSFSLSRNYILLTLKLLSLFLLFYRFPSSSSIVVGCSHKRKEHNWLN